MKEMKKRLIVVLLAAAAVLSGGSIIYMNADDTSCGRLGASYLTDINGSFDRKL